MWEGCGRLKNTFYSAATWSATDTPFSEDIARENNQESTQKGS